jgi:hypothetical protein
MEPAFEKVPPYHLSLSRPPRLTFGEPSLPLRIPEVAWCIDTTLVRGGARALRPARLPELFELLCQLNGGLIKQAEVEVRNSEEAEVLAELVRRYNGGELSVQPIAVITPRVEAISRLASFGITEAGIPISFSADAPLLLGNDPSPDFQPLLRLLDVCLEENVQPRMDLLDSFGAGAACLTLSLLRACLDHLAKRGAGRLRVRLCDSSGQGQPWPEAQPGRSVPALFQRLNRELGLQSGQLEFLGHDHLGLALANSLAAWLHGCSGLACSIGGRGQGAGISSTELLLFHLGGFYGIESHFENVEKLREVVRSSEQEGS